MVGDYDDGNTLPKDADGRPAGCEVMKDFLESEFPQCFRAINWEQNVQYRWTGIQGFTKNGKSLVGRHSKDSPGEFISLGHNGEGMGRCFASATIMVDRLLHYLEGKEDDTWIPEDWFPKSFLYKI